MNKPFNALKILTISLLLGLIAFEGIDFCYWLDIYDWGLLAGFHSVPFKEEAVKLAMALVGIKILKPKNLKEVLAIGLFVGFGFTLLEDMRYVQYYGYKVFSPRVFNNILCHATWTGLTTISAYPVRVKRDRRRILVAIVGLAIGITAHLIHNDVASGLWRLNDTYISIILNLALFAEILVLTIFYEIISVFLIRDEGGITWVQLQVFILAASSIPLSLAVLLVFIVVFAAGTLLQGGEVCFERYPPPVIAIILFAAFILEFGSALTYLTLHRLFFKGRNPEYIPKVTGTLLALHALVFYFLFVNSSILWPVYDRTAFLVFAGIPGIFGLCLLFIGFGLPRLRSAIAAIALVAILSLSLNAVYGKIDWELDSECKAISSGLERDSCYARLASELNLDRYCEEITNSTVSDDCKFMTLSNCKGTCCSCDKIKDSDIRQHCNAYVMRDPGICASIAGEEERDWCMSNLGAALRNQTLCSLTGKLSIRDSCFDRVGRALSDPNICDKVEDRTVRDSCYGEVGGRTRNASICRMIKDQDNLGWCLKDVGIRLNKTDVCFQSTNQTARDMCITMIARKLADPTVCKGVLDDAARDMCYYDVVDETNNNSICTQIQNQTLADNCQGKECFMLSNKSICDLIADPSIREYYYAGFERDESRCGGIEKNMTKADCYGFVARTKNDPTICDRMDNLTLRDYCYYGYGTNLEDTTVCYRIQDQTLKGRCYREG